MPEPKQSETLKQIQAAFEESQSQLATLREQVQYLAQLAQAKVARNVLERDLDRAYRDLGETVWAEVSKGKLALPANLTAVKKSLEQVTVKIQAQNAGINDLLAEGADIARLIQEKVNAPSKGLPGSTKKK